MTTHSGNRPAEIFGYPIWDNSRMAEDARRRRVCPFLRRTCSKKSRLIDFPFGVCSAEYGGQIRSVCPHRFLEQGSLSNVSMVFEEVALNYFGDFNNIVIFSEVRLPSVGSIDFVLVRHKPMQPEVDDFVSVEFQSDSTTSTGQLVQGMRDFVDGHDIQSRSYRFGMNTYDSLKRTMTQLMNKGIVYESWGTKCYWVIQEYLYDNLVNRYGFKPEGFSDHDASRFALYNIVQEGDLLTLQLNRLVSTTVDEVYRAIRDNPNMPNKDEFVNRLNARLRRTLQIKVR